MIKVSDNHFLCSFSCLFAVALCYLIFPSWVHDSTGSTTYATLAPAASRYAQFRFTAPRFYTDIASDNFYCCNVILHRLRWSLTLVHTRMIKRPSLVKVNISTAQTLSTTQRENQNNLFQRCLNGLLHSIRLYSIFLICSLFPHK